MNPILEPVLNDALIRFSKFNKPSQADAVRILGPALGAVCMSATQPAERATEWLQSQALETITSDSVRQFVRSVTEVPKDVLEVAHARQAQIEAQLASERPLPYDEQERHLPIAERSLVALKAGIHAASWAGRTKDQRAMEDELDKRDAAAESIPYEPRFRLTDAGALYVSGSPGRFGF